MPKIIMMITIFITALPAGCESKPDAPAERYPAPEEPEAVAEPEKSPAEKCEDDDLSACLVVAQEKLDQAFRARIEEGEVVWQEVAVLLHRVCDAGLQLGCARLSELYRGGRGVEEDLERAQELAHTACEADEPYGCFSLAIMWEVVEEFEASIEDIMTMYGRACEGGLAPACHELGMVYESGRRGAPQDFEEALRLVQRGCDLEDPEACEELERMKKVSP